MPLYAGLQHGGGPGVVDGTPVLHHHVHQLLQHLLGGQQHVLPAVVVCRVHVSAGVLRHLPARVLSLTQVGVVTCQADCLSWGRIESKLIELN